MKKVFIIFFIFISLFSCKKRKYFKKTGEVMEINCEYPSCLGDETIIQNRLSNIHLSYLDNMFHDKEILNYSFELNNDYELISEDEPDYLKYFSKDLILNGIDVYVNSWEVNGCIIKCCSKLEDKTDEKIIFSSIEYKKDEIIF